MTKRGFSTIEMLVVVVVVGALLLVSIPNFQDAKLKLSLARTATQFSEYVRKAQQLALSEVPYKNTSGAEQPIRGYGVYVDLNGLGSKKYIVYADKAPGNKAYDEGDYIVESVDFSFQDSGVKIKELRGVASNKASVNFNNSIIETTITQLNAGTNQVEFIFVLESDASITKSVLVNNVGLIEIK